MIACLLLTDGGGIPLNDAYVFDPEGGLWMQIEAGDAAFARYAFCFTATSNFLYVHGGSDANGQDPSGQHRLSQSNSGFCSVFGGYTWQRTQ